MYACNFQWCSIRLEKEAEELSKAGDTESERLMDVYERLDELDASTAETKAARILHGLGIMDMFYNVTTVSYIQLASISVIIDCSHIVEVGMTRLDHEKLL